MDIFHPFIMSMSLQALTRTITPGDGSEIPQDLSDSPEVSVSGQTHTQVSIIIISPIATISMCKLLIFFFSSGHCFDYNILILRNALYD